MPERVLMQPTRLLGIHNLPRCADCGCKVVSGPERLALVRAGEAIPVCHDCWGLPRNRRPDEVRKE